MSSTGVQPVPLVVVPRGFILYHGTDSRGSYSVPDGPAWFTRSYPVAARWAGWASPPPGRARGREKRVFQLACRSTLSVFDIRRVIHRRTLASIFCDEPEANSYQLALALHAEGFYGWMGISSGCGYIEYMICHPGAYLDHVRTFRGVIADPIPAEKWKG